MRVDNNNNNGWVPPMTAADFKEVVKENPVRPLCAETDKHNRKQSKKKSDNRLARDSLSELSLLMIQEYLSKLSQYGRCFDLNNKKPLTCT